MRRLIILLSLVSLACMSTAPIVTVAPSVVPSVTSVPLLLVASITPRVLARGVPTAPTHFVCADRWLNVRDMPDPFSNVISTLSSGAVVSVYETQSGWARIGEGRWVNGKYLCQ